MTAITADDKLVSELAMCNSVVEIRNKEGVVIGFFAPLRLEYAEQYARVAAKTHSSGMHRVSKTTTEVLADLRASHN